MFWNENKTQNFFDSPPNPTPQSLKAKNGRSGIRGGEGSPDPPPPTPYQQPSILKKNGSGKKKNHKKNKKREIKK